MAAISLSDCTVTHLLGTPKMVKIVTPATADDGDTIDVSSLYKNGCMAVASSSTDNQEWSADEYNTTITLPGSTDNEARTIIAIGE